MRFFAPCHSPYKCAQAALRWIRERFGQSSFTALGLPGGDIVDAGLADLAAGKVSAESLAVSLAAPRLRREGVPIVTTLPEPENRLFDLLSRASGELAHSRYCAYRQQLESFGDACGLVRRRSAAHAK
jgi:hypothetical protein